MESVTAAALAFAPDQDHLAEVDRLVRAVEHRPMYFSSLVVETTNRCNARCGMCYQASGPRGSDLVGDHHIDAAVLKRAITDALNIRSLEPRLHLAGGEAFIHMDECLDYMACARDNGYISITATTNAFWAASPVKALEVAGRMQAAGLTSIEISWDHWHSPFISAHSVENAIHAFFLLGVPVNLRILGTKSHGYDECLAKLSNKAIGRANQITAGPVFPTGRAATAIPRSDIYFTDPGIGGACHGALNLTIVASGKVFPCCAGLDQTRQMDFGNINNQSIANIAARLIANPMVRILVFHGPKALIDIAGTEEQKRWGRYANICDACWDCFDDAGFADRMHRLFGAYAEDQLSRMLHELPVPIGGGALSACP